MHSAARKPEAQTSLRSSHDEVQLTLVHSEPQGYEGPFGKEWTVMRLTLERAGVVSFKYTLADPGSSTFYLNPLFNAIHEPDPSICASPFAAIDSVTVVNASSSGCATVALFASEQTIPNLPSYEESGAWQLMFVGYGCYADGSTTPVISIDPNNWYQTHPYGPVPTVVSAIRVPGLNAFSQAAQARVLTVMNNLVFTDGTAGNARVQISNVGATTASSRRQASHNRGAQAENDANTILRTTTSVLKFDITFFAVTHAEMVEIRVDPPLSAPSTKMADARLGVLRMEHFICCTARRDTDDFLLGADQEFLKRRCIDDSGILQ